MFAVEPIGSASEQFCSDAEQTPMWPYGGIKKPSWRRQSSHFVGRAWRTAHNSCNLCNNSGSFAIFTAIRWASSCGAHAMT